MPKQTPVGKVSARVVINKDTEMDICTNGCLYSIVPKAGKTKR